MNVRRETPSILELCHRFNKSKDQEVASNLNDSLESERGPGFRRLRSGQSHPKAYESKVSQVIREKCFPHVKNRNELRFSRVETRSSLVFYDSYDSDAESSSEEDCNTLAGPSQAQNGYVMVNNPQPARLYGEESQPQRDEKEIFRKIRHRGLENIGSFLPRVVGHQRQGNFQKQSNTQGYSHSQANRQSCPHYHHGPFRHAANSLEYPSLRASTSRGYSRHYQDQEKNGRRQTRYSQTSSLYVYTQQNIQRNKANSPQGSHNEWNMRETKQPPIQQLNDRTRDTEALPRQLRASKQRRPGRQEVCEAKNQRRERRKGACEVTDSAREQRTFARVLGKRF